jgi:hypothetical protein
MAFSTHQTYLSNLPSTIITSAKQKCESNAIMIIVGIKPYFQIHLSQSFLIFNKASKMINHHQNQLMVDFQ